MKKYKLILSLAGFLFLAGCNLNLVGLTKQDANKKIELLENDLYSSKEEYMRLFVLPTLQDRNLDGRYYEHGGRGKINGEEINLEIMENPMKEEPCCKFYTSKEDIEEIVKDYDYHIHTHIPGNRTNPYREASKEDYEN